jgi:hypothetical protein
MSQRCHKRLLAELQQLPATVGKPKAEFAGNLQAGDLYMAARHF